MFKDEMDYAGLALRLKHAKDKIAAFESGEKYVQMKAEWRKIHNADIRTINRLEKELCEARKEAIHVRDLWFATCEDILKEKERALAEKDREIERLKKEIKAAGEKTDEYHGKFLTKTKEVYEVQTKLEEEQEKNAALQERIQQDYSNSSISSSMKPNHPPIQNGRQKSEKKPGGQPGHEHHGRKRLKPTRTEKIPTPPEYRDTGKFKPTGKWIKKQLIRLCVHTEVIEYMAEEFRNQETGQRVHADFPGGLTDDVTYDGTVKAMAYLVNNSLYTSIDKTRVFMEEITHGQIKLSNGFICKLSKEFSEKTEEERDKIFLQLATSKTLHGDFTFGRTAGKQSAVIVTANEEVVLYQGREKKGDEGIKGSPLEYYNGILVSDHEAAIRKHGSRNQECLSHLLRYAKSGIENEPEKTWHRELAEWIGKSVSYWNAVKDEQKEYDTAEAEKYITELREIVQCAEEEYEYEPPSKYYRKGINTYIRMKKDLEDYVLFLREQEVPPTNNLAERYGRKYKRKSHQVMTFRSQEGSNRFCDGLTILESVRRKGENTYDAVTKIFNKGLEVTV